MLSMAAVWQVRQVDGLHLDEPHVSFMKVDHFHLQVRCSQTVNRTRLTFHAVLLMWQGKWPHISD
jgi:hypothetical protein